MGNDTRPVAPTLRRLAICLAATALSSAPAAEAVELRRYSLGDVTIPDASPFGRLPVRLEGAIAVPRAAGPHPLVVVAHGRHPVGCPHIDDEFERWPCFGRDRRYDLGLRHVLRALARRGLVAVAPNVNGAHTEGWGEPDDRRRWPRIVKRHLRALASDVNYGGTRFGVQLRSRVRLGRIGFLGHSLSGLNSVRLALRRERRPGPADRGQARLRALFLLAPVDGARLADVPTAVVLGGCDFDTGRLGRRYLDAARRRGDRRNPVFEATLRRANHNFYNRTLVALRNDDAEGVRGRCRSGRRLRARTQQRWVRRAAAHFFAATLSRPRALKRLRRAYRPRTRLWGRAVRVRRFLP